MSSTSFQSEPATLLTKKPTATPASYVALAITSASRSRRAEARRRFSALPPWG
ncbi:hypothetical protein PG996_012596 [Apiospora saccharicola]|uniref:Uncharacterized protein n=1 Tax=Apiospora saccharicola TaxID=335842 RepID=A0ABR1U317_9PEZI